MHFACVQPARIPASLQAGKMRRREINKVRIAAGCGWRSGRTGPPGRCKKGSWGQQPALRKITLYFGAEPWIFTVQITNDRFQLGVDLLKAFLRHPAAVNLDGTQIRHSTGLVTTGDPAHVNGWTAQYRMCPEVEFGYIFVGRCVQSAARPWLRRWTPSSSLPPWTFLPKTSIFQPFETFVANGNFSDRWVRR